MQTNVNFPDLRRSATPPRECGKKYGGSHQQSESCQEQTTDDRHYLAKGLLTMGDPIENHRDWYDGQEENN